MHPDHPDPAAHGHPRKAATPRDELRALLGYIDAQVVERRADAPLDVFAHAPHLLDGSAERVADAPVFVASVNQGGAKIP
jgi:hypothetical protein